MYFPVARSSCDHSMNRSNAVTLGGGAQMNRFTDGVVSSAYSVGASEARSSRRIRWSPASSGSPPRHSTALVSACLPGRWPSPRVNRVTPGHRVTPHYRVPAAVAPDDRVAGVVAPHNRVPVDGVAPDNGVAPD